MNHILKAPFWCVVLRTQDSVQNIELKIQQHKEQQAKTLEEYHAVDRERNNLQAIRSRSDYPNQVGSLQQFPF